MPKEVIFGDSSSPFEIRVGWQADGEHVHVGVETAAGVSLVTALYGDPAALRTIGQRFGDRFGQLPSVSGAEDKAQALEELGRAVLDTVEASQTNPGSTGYTGAWTTLDRTRSNKLIRVLRRARDAAFGKDE